MVCRRLLICAQDMLPRSHRRVALVLVVAAALPWLEARAQAALGQPGPAAPPAAPTAPAAASPRPAGEPPPPPPAAPATTAQAPPEPLPPPPPVAPEQPTRVEWTPLPPESAPSAPTTPRRSSITEAGLPVSKRGA